MLCHIKHFKKLIPKQEGYMTSTCKHELKPELINLLMAVFLWSAPRQQRRKPSLQAVAETKVSGSCSLIPTQLFVGRNDHMSRKYLTGYGVHCSSRYSPLYPWIQPTAMRLDPILALYLALRGAKRSFIGDALLCTLRGTINYYPPTHTSQCGWQRIL